MSPVGGGDPNAGAAGWWELVAGAVFFCWLGFLSWVAGRRGKDDR